MSGTYEKACAGEYLEVFDKNGNLIRTAEQFENGNWVVHTYSTSHPDVSGEYSPDKFKRIRRFFFKKS